MFLKFEQFIVEKNLPKKKWVELDKPTEFSDNLIDIVKKAYAKTPKGSFINKKSDVDQSDWISIDFDENPDIDATIFYRLPRKNENWKGKKIQGIGHDGTREAIDILLNRLKTLLTQSGFWVEASDALQKVLYKMNVPYIDNELEALKIFPNSNLKFIGDKGKYKRELGNNEIVQETIFGKPIIK
jgi:hypothetical protein